MEEIWKPVVGYEGIYEVSSFGGIRSLDRIDCSGHKRKGKPRHSNPTRAGYLILYFSNKGVHSKKTLHSVVARAFLGERKRGYVIDHIDGNKQNNRVDNLEYVTSIENSRRHYQSKSKSGCVGVHFSNTRRKWIAVFRQKQLGAFDSKQDAIKIRLERESEYNGIP